MSETFPAVPADLLMRIVDDALDYGETYGNFWGVFYRGGRRVGTVSLGPCHDPMAEVISAGCWGRSVGADQAVWVLSTVSDDYPVGRPHLVMIYTDELGAQIMRMRRLAIYDDGTVGPAGSWEDYPVDESRMAAAAIPWNLHAGDAPSIRMLLESRGHIVHPA